MEAQRMTPLSDLARELLLKESFLKKLGIRREASGRLLGSVPWTQLTAPLEPITGRISCARALDAFRPLLDTIALEPAEGWLPYTYQVARCMLYPEADRTHTSAQWDGK